MGVVLEDPVQYQMVDQHAAVTKHVTTSKTVFFFFLNNILCIKQRIHKIATKANTSAYPRKKNDKVQ